MRKAWDKWETRMERYLESLKQRAHFWYLGKTEG